MQETEYWTPERREQERQAIMRKQPWLKSTGPRTAEGKARSSRNAWKGGARPMQRDLAKFLRAQTKAMAAFN